MKHLGSWDNIKVENLWKCNRISSLSCCFSSSFIEIPGIRKEVAQGRPSQYASILPWNSKHLFDFFTHILKPNHIALDVFHYLINSIYIRNKILLSNFYIRCFKTMKSKHKPKMCFPLHFNHCGLARLPDTLVCRHFQCCIIFVQISTLISDNSFNNNRHL